MNNQIETIKEHLKWKLDEDNVFTVQERDKLIESIAPGYYPRAIFHFGEGQPDDKSTGFLLYAENSLYLILLPETRKLIVTDELESYDVQDYDYLE